MLSLDIFKNDFIYLNIFLSKIKLNNIYRYIIIFILFILLKFLSSTDKTKLFIVHLTLLNLNFQML